MDTWIWIVIVVLALLIVGALVAVSLRKKREVNAERASTIRTEAAQQGPELRRREAEVQSAEAEQLEAIAQEERTKVEEQQSELHDKLRTADKLDPNTEPAPRQKGT